MITLEGILTALEEMARLSDQASDELTQAEEEWQEKFDDFIEHATGKSKELREAQARNTYRKEYNRYRRAKANDKRIDRALRILENRLKGEQTHQANNRLGGG